MRLEDRGMQGTFLNAIKAMYRTVIQKVKVDGSHRGRLGDDLV